MTRFVAELGSNHNNSVRRGEQLIRAAHAAGCDAVKVQLYAATRLYHESQRAKIQAAKGSQMDRELLPIFAAIARQLGVEFGCSVFDLDGAIFAAPHCDWLKVSSYNLLDAHLIREAATLSKAGLVLSAGMASLDEVRTAVRLAAAAGKDMHDLEVLHCVSCYPCPLEACHLEHVEYLDSQLPCRVGYSDHSGEDSAILVAALRYRASSIEVHVDLGDRAGYETSGGHCWDLTRLARVIDTVRQGETADTVMPDVRPDAAESAWRADPVDGLRPRAFRR